MSRINPKDYPFNYVVHFTTDGKVVEATFGTYYRAEDFVKVNWPELVLSDTWNEDDKLAGELLCLDPYSKTAWDPEHRAKVESLLLEFRDETVKDFDKSYDDAMEIAQRQVRIQRLRDAYYNACMEADLEEKVDYSDDSDDPDIPGAFDGPYTESDDDDERFSEAKANVIWPKKPFIDPYESFKLDAMNIQEGEESITFHDVYHLRAWSKGMIRQFLCHPNNTDGMVSLRKVVEFEDSRTFKNRIAKLRQHLANGMSHPNAAAIIAERNGIDQD